MFDDDWGVGAVARHKKDEIDKPMELAVPGERIAFGAVVLFIALVAAVASLVSVNRNLSLEGELHRPAAGGSWRASLSATPAVAHIIAPGMTAQIEVVTPSGAVLVLPGEVLAPMQTSPTTTPPGDPSLPDAFALHISVAVDASAAAESSLSALAENSACRITIPLGRQSIIRALASA